jgi:hypothetical protein
MLNKPLLSNTKISDEHEATNSILYSGRVRFPGINVRSAEVNSTNLFTQFRSRSLQIFFILQYVIVKEDENCHQYLLDMFHDPDGGWNLKKPELILSITGATKSFQMSSRYKKAFKQGLVKAAELVDCWILTNGFSSGITKVVGEAIAENSYKSKVTSIGVVSKSVISFNETLEVLN